MSEQHTPSDEIVSIDENEIVSTDEIVGNSPAVRPELGSAKRRAAVVFGLGAAALAGLAISTSVTHADQTHFNARPDSTCCIIREP